MDRNKARGYRLDDQIGFILRRVNQRHLAIFAGLIGDLTPTQFAALAKLVEMGPLSQNELGRQTAMDAATIKGVIDRLRERGLAESLPDENDRRRLTIAATKPGQALFGDRVEAAQGITRQTLAPLDEAERARLLELLRKIT